MFFFRSTLGKALAKAGGQPLRDAVAQASTAGNLTAAGDGKISKNKFQYVFHFD